MKKLLLVLLAVSATLAPTLGLAQERRSIIIVRKAFWERNGVPNNCYITGFQNGPVKVCQGQPEWNQGFQTVFDSIDHLNDYTNSYGVNRSVHRDLDDGHGLGPWIQHVLMPEYQRRGVRF